MMILRGVASDATKAGKQRQYDRGQRPGGPVLDGMLLRVERDGQDRVIARLYLPDREGRAPTIARLFDLSEEGHGDAAVAKRHLAPLHSSWCVAEPCTALPRVK